LVATSISDTEIDLSWTDNATDETEFKIERKIGLGGTYTQIGTAPADVTYYQDLTCFAGVHYYYRVRASNGSGDSAYSNEADATTTGTYVAGSATLRALPFSNVSATDGTLYTNLSNLGYNILEYANSVSYPNDAYWWSGTPTCTVVGNDTRYDFCGITWDGTWRVPLFGAGDLRGGTATITISPNVSGATTNKMAMIVSSDGNGGATYTLNTISVGSDVFTFNQAVTVSGNNNATVAEFTLVFSPGQTIVMTVSYPSVNWSGVSLAFVQDVQLPPIPAVPTGLTAVTNSLAPTSEIDLNWADTDPNAISFRIERMGGQDLTFRQIAFVTGATTYSDIGLTPATQYTYRVRASNAGGDSGYSSTATTTTAGVYVAGTATWNSTLLYNDTDNVMPNADGELDAGLKSHGYNVLVYQSGTPGCAVTPSTPSWWSGVPTYTQVSGANNTGGVYGNYGGVVYNWTGGNPRVALGTGQYGSSTINKVKITITPNNLTRITNTMAVVLTTTDPGDVGTGTGSATLDSVQIGATVIPINQTLAATANSSRPVGIGVVGEVQLAIPAGETVQVTLTYGMGAIWSGVSLAFKNSALPPAPAAPSGVTAVAVSGTQINVGWKINDTNATGYYILRSDNSGGNRASSQGNVAAGIGRYNNTGLTSGRVYAYMIAAQGAGGCSYSSRANGNHWPNTPPSTMVTVTAGTLVYGTAWTATSGGVCDRSVTQS
jgi:hypothetical protein